MAFKEPVLMSKMHLTTLLTLLVGVVVPAWELWDGIPPVKYQKGSKVSHNGKKWESMVDNNVWEPGTFGVGEEIWREILQ